MNAEEFTHLITNPNTVSKAQTLKLESVIDDFPYFQTARVLHLKGLKNQRDFKYNNTLKTVAAYTTNRTILFDFITFDVLDYNETNQSEETIINDIEVIDSKVIEHLFKSISVSDSKKDIEETTQVSIPEKEEVKSKKKIDLEVGSPIIFNKNDTFSFNEWLQLNPSQPIIRKKSVKKQSKNLDDKLNLIDQFIQNKPKIQPIKTQKNIDVATESTTENTDLMTHTLARVYLEQKKYKKAISAFKILSLKYPEKSSFFADRIKAIEFLQKHKS
jgi:hypothetical protein